MPAEVPVPAERLQAHEFCLCADGVKSSIWARTSLRGSYLLHNTDDEKDNVRVLTLSIRGDGRFLAAETGLWRDGAFSRVDHVRSDTDGVVRIRSWSDVVVVLNTYAATLLKWIAGPSSAC